MGESDDDLLSRTGVHYHWRGLVSRSCSGWEGVVPRRYGRQTVTCAVFPDVLGRTSKRKKCFFACCVGVCESVFYAVRLYFTCGHCKVIGSSLTGN